MDIKGNIKLEKLAGLALNKYPQEYKEYIAEEGKAVLELINKDIKLLDVGCGSDMHLETIAKSVKEYQGIELDDALLYDAKDKLGKLKTAKLEKIDVHHASSKFARKHFDISICLWNSLGSMGDELHFLEEVSKVTKDKIVLSLIEKGHIDVRSKYYEDLESTYLVMDDGHETIASPIWGYSRAYSKEDIEKYAKAIKWQVTKFKQLGKIGLLAILTKK